MEPERISPPAPYQPPGGWLTRTCTALFRDRRLPTSIRTLLDKTLQRVGWETRTICVEGLRISVRRLTADEHFVDDVFSQREYTAPGYEIHESDVVIDVGGNIGAFALYAGRRARHGKVISIEPIEANYALLVRNIKRNRLDHVQPMRAAVTTSTGDVPVYISPLGTGHHSTSAELAGSDGDCQHVPGVRLRDLFEQLQVDRCNFLKMDCEGAEFDILFNLSSALFAKIDKLAVEYHTPLDGPKRPHGDRLVELLQRQGMIVDVYTDVEGTNRGIILARRSDE